jgi:hypothetical protein
VTRVLIVASALLLWTNGLMASAGASAQAVTEPTAETRLLDQIKAEIGSAACTTDAQCRTLPVGAKACGGPAAWWPWSEAHANGQRLQDWAEKLDRLQRNRFEASGMLSNCQFVPDPGASCATGRCVLQDRKGVM